MNAPSNHGASLEALAAYRSAETIERGEAAERAREALDRESDARADGRFGKLWRALRVEVARALSAPAPPKGHATKDYSQPYVDGQREALELVARRMKQMEEGGGS